MTFDRRKFLTTGVLGTFATAMTARQAQASTQAPHKNSKNEVSGSQSQSKSSSGRTQMGGGDPTRTAAFQPLPYTSKDELSLADGFDWYSIVRAGDVINEKGDRAGDCCDFLHFIQGASPNQAFLWINHEYLLDNVLYERPSNPETKSKEQVDAEMKMVGGSFVELKRTQHSDGTNRWVLKSDSKLAFRIDANTPMDMVGPAGGRSVLGTLANCSGGYTPWGTILTAEENFDVYFKQHEGTFRGYYGWGKYYPRNEEDYGWVVEVNPETQKARKLTSLGRFAHESATVTKSKDGRVVVYSGDDAKGQCLYKFISNGKISGDAKKDADLLLDGNLYVANLSKSEWILLSPENPALAKDEKFKSLRNILVNTRDAAKVAGGTKLNRPEDIKVDPRTGDVYFVLTNNADVGDLHGSINILREQGQDAAATKFEYESFIVGGLRTGLTCPDNLTFGPSETLWACTDMSASVMGKGAFSAFARNSMHRIELNSNGSVFVRHFLQAPRDAELTGPVFLPDGSGLLVSVQHPGESSYEKDGVGLTSHWPDGGKSKPLSTVVCVVPTRDRREMFVV